VPSTRRKGKCGGPANVQKILRPFLKRLPLLIEVLVDVVGGLNALAGVIENSLRLYRP